MPVRLDNAITIGKWLTAIAPIVENVERKGLLIGHDLMVALTILVNLSLVKSAGKKWRNKYGKRIYRTVE